MINKFYSIFILLPVAIASSEFFNSSINPLESNELSGILIAHESQNNDVLLSLEGEAPNMKIVLSEIPSDTQYKNYITDDVVEVRLFLKNTITPTTSQSLSIPEAGLKNISIITGPESGYSPAEREIMSELGLQSLKIGHYVLRAETAPVVGLSKFHSLFGEY